MIGEPLNIYYAAGIKVWYVAFSMLGYEDWKTIIKPWCDENLEHGGEFVPSATVKCLSEADATLVYLRFK